MNHKVFYRISITACLLAFLVIILGAYVRLSDAGLGCPDWPGCYGQITAPDTAEEISKARLKYPDSNINSGKAWKEMLHRYFAGALGLIILVIAVMALKQRKLKNDPVLLPIILLGLVILQGLLGMWTVTLLLKPAIVTLHLLTGLLTLSLLCWLCLSLTRRLKANIFNIRIPDRLIKWSQIGLLLLIIQIFLGGWTSTNYAALYCTDFPTCQGKWVPDTDFYEAYTFFKGFDVNYEGGVLSNKAGVTVHFMHRLGALVCFIVLMGLSIALYASSGNKLIKNISFSIMTLLIIQVSLGIANVLLLLPIAVAVSHNAVASLLLLYMVTLNFILYSPQYNRIENTKYERDKLKVQRNFI